MNTLQKFDLVIIGGGILGLLAALKVVQEKPTWRIAIYDRDLIGSGARRYSLGMSYSYAKSRFRKTLTEESLPEWDRIRQLIPGLPMRRLNLYGFSKHENLDKTVNNFVTLEANPSKPSVLTDENKSSFLKQFPWLQLSDMTDLLEANYAYGPDLNPVICSLGDNPRLIYAGAGSGSGFRLGPAIANRAIKMILDHAGNET